MFKFIGYQKTTRYVNFTFLIPLFKKDGAIYRCINEINSGKIIDFSPINLEEEQIEHTEDKTYYCDVNDCGFYAFNYKQNIFCGTKGEINKYLIETIRYGTLSLTEKYDIYFFWGNHKKIIEVIGEFVKTWPEGIINVDNFLFPSFTKISVAEMPTHLTELADMLDFWSDVFNYENMFKADNDGFINFLNYQIDKRALQNQFSSLIKQYHSPVFRDLIVHCFVQNNIFDDGMFLNQEFKYRILIPLIESTEVPSYVTEVIVANMNGVSVKKVLNTLEEKHAMDKRQIEFTIHSSMNILEQEKKEKELKSSINKIKMQSA